MVSPYVFSFTTRTPRPPRVVNTYPADSQTDVPVGENITIGFDLDMEAPATAAAFSISPAISGTAAVSAKVLTWSHTSNFQPTTIYSVTIARTAKSLAGDEMLSDYRFNFSTGTVDAPPKVLSTSPADKETGVALDQSVVVKFDMDMDPVATAGAISISPVVPGGVGDVSGGTLTWNHSKEFQSSTLYTVTISTAARNTKGVALASPYSFLFLTATDSQPVDPDEIVFTVQQPVLNVNEVVDVYYNVYDLAGKPIGTVDTWDFSPKDVADVKYLGGHRFSVAGLKEGKLKITVTAQGDTKSLTNSTTLDFRIAATPGPYQTVMGIPLWLLLALIALAGAVPLLFFVLRRRRAREPPMLSPFGVSVLPPAPSGTAGPPPPPTPTPPPPPNGARDAAKRIAENRAKNR